MPDTTPQVLAVMALMREIEKPSACYNRAVRRAAQTLTDSPENDAAQVRGNAALLEIEQAVRAWVSKHHNPTPARLVLGTTDQQPETADCTCITAPEVDDSGQVLHSSYCMTVIDQQPETAPDTGLRDRIAAAVRGLNEDGGRLADLDEENDVFALADAVLAVLPAPVDRAAVLREAANYAQQVAKAMATSDEDWASRAGWACASVATGLRRMADEAQQPTT
ncbi:hypothetical protein AB0I93_14385 [Streptomyces sp. NPDC049967]|uniref:hypothetical protein n=1 Tax=Streptomyces sp. NPDC049967 TaxID=3155658 RepID=UPI003416097C